MKTLKIRLNFEKLVNLFFLFVIGTISFMIYHLYVFPTFKWSEGLKFALFLIGVFSYEAVIISLLLYYLAKGKKKAAEYFEKFPNLIYIVTFSLFGITYILLNLIIEKSVIIFFRDLVMLGLILLTMPFVSNWFKKKKTVKTKKKKFKQTKK